MKPDCNLSNVVNKAVALLTNTRNSNQKQRDFNQILEKKTQVKSAFKFKKCNAEPEAEARLKTLFPDGTHYEYLFEFMRELGAEGCYGPDTDKWENGEKSIACHYAEKGFPVYTKWIVSADVDENGNMYNLQVKTGFVGL